MKNHGLRLKTLIFGISAFFLLLLFAWPTAGLGQAARLEFETPPRLVAPDELSEVITVQIQDAAGGRSAIGQTADVVFVSSSATGEFLNQNGDPASTVMARTASRRNFYYRDLSEGLHTLTVTVKTRETGASFNASQIITVGYGREETELDSDDSSATADDRPQSNVSSSSAHAGVPAVSSAIPPPAAPLQVDPGRPRLSVAGVPIYFQARVSGGQPRTGPEGTAVRINWSFGDGRSAFGPNAAHTYHFPGTYLVVVNVSQGDNRAVGRTSVEVIQPEVEIGEAGFQPRPYVQILNHSNRELNLGRWRVEVGSTDLILPADTLLAPKAELHFPLDLERVDLESLTLAELKLFYPNGRLAAGRRLETADSTLASSSAVKPLEIDSRQWQRLTGQINRLAEALKTQPLPFTGRLADRQAIAPAPLSVRSEPLPGLDNQASAPVLSSFGEAIKRGEAAERVTEVKRIDPNQRPGFWRRFWRALRDLF